MESFESTRGVSATPVGCVLARKAGEGGGLTYPTS